MALCTASDRILSWQSHPFHLRLVLDSGYTGRVPTGTGLGPNLLTHQKPIPTSTQTCMCHLEFWVSFFVFLFFFFGCFSTLLMTFYIQTATTTILTHNHENNTQETHLTHHPYCDGSSHTGHRPNMAIIHTILPCPHHCMGISLIVGWCVLDLASWASLLLLPNIKWRKFWWTLRKA